MKSIILLAEGFEEVEALTVVDLLRRGDIQVDMISMEVELDVKGGHDIIVKADLSICDIDEKNYELLILPGGLVGVQNLQKNKIVQELIQSFVSSSRKVAAICAAPTILGEGHWLKEKVATCYPGLEDRLHCKETSKEKVCVDGNIITSRGIGTAIDFALKLIEIGQGQVVAEEVKSSIVY